MKKIILIILLLVIPSVCFSSPVLEMEERIEQHKIASYILTWLIQRQEQEFIIVYEGNDDETIKAIKESVNSLIPLGGNEHIQVDQAPVGRLILLYSHGYEEMIDVTDIGFFVGHKRSLDGVFYSPGLSKIVKEMLDKSKYRKCFMSKDNNEDFLLNREKYNECLILSDDIFTELSKGGKLNDVRNKGEIQK